MDPNSGRPEGASALTNSAALRTGCCSDGVCLVPRPGNHAQEGECGIVQAPLPRRCDDNLVGSSSSNGLAKGEDEVLMKWMPKQAGAKSSRYRGVCWLNHRKVWRARIESDGKKIHIGYFETEDEAARVYDKHAFILNGLRGKFNFPEEVLKSNREEIEKEVRERQLGEAQRAKKPEDASSLSSSSPFDSPRSMHSGSSSLGGRKRSRDSLGADADCEVEQVGTIPRSTGCSSSLSNSSSSSSSCCSVPRVEVPRKSAKREMALHIGIENRNRIQPVYAAVDPIGAVGPSISPASHCIPRSGVFSPKFNPLLPQAFTGQVSQRAYAAYVKASTLGSGARGGNATMDWTSPFAAVANEHQHMRIANPAAAARCAGGLDFQQSFATPKIFPRGSLNPCAPASPFIQGASCAIPVAQNPGLLLPNAMPFLNRTLPSSSSSSCCTSFTPQVISPVHSSNVPMNPMAEYHRQHMKKMLQHLQQQQQQQQQQANSTGYAGAGSFSSFHSGLHM